MPENRKQIDVPRAGPFVEVRIKYSCRGCIHHSAKSYAVQGDSGVDDYCNEPSQGIRETSLGAWETPKWCPFRTQE